MVTSTMLINALFFLSGFSALVYEITWARKLSLIFGTDSYGIATILAVFFTGLALGSYLYSVIAKKEVAASAGSRSAGQSRILSKPLFLYALLEFGIGIFALFSPLIFEAIKLLQSGFWQIFTPSFGSFNFFTFLLSLFALIIPTTLMGATLPAIIAATDKNKAGFLYGINTLGAVFGVLLTGFVFIATIGVNETIWLAAAINLIIGFTAFKLSPNFTLKSSVSENQQLPASIGNKSALISVLFFYFLSGAAAIGLEVLWTRVLTLTIGGSTYAFTIILSAFLIGIALGSLAASKLFSYTRRPLLWFAILQSILGVLVIFSLPLLSRLPLTFLSAFHKFGSDFGNLQFGIFLLSAMVIFLPTFIMGMAFPLVAKSLSFDISLVARIYAGNTIGGVFGSLITGFLLIPLFGTPKSIYLMAALYLLIACLIYLHIERNKYKKLTSFIILLIFLLAGFKYTAWENRLFTSGLYVDPGEYRGLDSVQVLKKLKKSPVLFEKEGIGALISVKKNTDGNLNMQINGKTDASTGSDMENQVLLGQLPLLLHPSPKEALIIGLGSGITLGSVLSHPVENVDVVEIEKDVVEAARYFKDYNNNALEDKRTNIIIADGRNFLAATRQKYDVISSEPSNPWLAGSSKLFTEEYFKLLKNSLKDDGIVLQWINMYAIDTNGIRSVIKSFIDVFPEVRAFGIPISNDLILFGSNKKIMLNSDELEKKLKNEKIKKDLAKASIEEPFELLARFYLDKKALIKISSAAPLNSDNYPYLEFQAPKKLHFASSENPWRLLFDNFTPISSLAPETDRQIINKAEELRKTWILTRIFYIEKNVGEGKIYAEKALQLDPDNPNLQANLAQFHFEEGNAYFKTKDYPKAVLSYEKSVSLKETPEAYFNLGQSYEDNIPEKAKAAYQKALSLDPLFTEVLSRLGSLYLDEGNLNHALETFNKLDELEPENKDTLVSLSQLYFLKQDFGSAQKYAKKVLKIDSKNEDALEILRRTDINNLLP